MPDSAQDFATKIAATYAGEPRRFAREWRVFCPVHETNTLNHNPSLAVWERGRGGVAFNCMVGCSHISVRKALSDKGVLAPASFVTTVEWQRKQRADHQLNEQRKLQAKAILDVSRDIKQSDPSTQYLESRGLFLTDPEKRFVRVARDKVYINSQLLIGIIVDPSTLDMPTIRVTGIQTLALKADGTPWLNAHGKKIRSVMGILRACGIPFGEAGADVVVGEGFESVVSAMKLLGVGFGISALSSSNVPNLALPKCVKRIFVCTDNDIAGDMAALRATTFWALAGYTVERRKWGVVGTGYDANDELRHRGT